MAAAYAERSPDGPDHFGVVAAKGFHLFGIEPELTAAFFAGLPEAQLAIVPGASHGLPMEHLQEVVGLIERFLGSDVPPVTHRDEDGQRLKEVNRRTPRCPAPVHLFQTLAVLVTVCHRRDVGPQEALDETDDLL